MFDPLNEMEETQITKYKAVIDVSIVLEENSSNTFYDTIQDILKTTEALNKKYDHHQFVNLQINVVESDGIDISNDEPFENETINEDSALFDVEKYIEPTEEPEHLYTRLLHHTVRHNVWRQFQMSSSYSDRQIEYVEIAKVFNYLLNTIDSLDPIYAVSIDLIRDYFKTHEYDTATENSVSVDELVSIFGDSTPDDYGIPITDPNFTLN